MRAPASRQVLPMATGSRVASSNPERILVVTGSGVAATTARTIRSTSPRSRRHPDPAVALHDLLDRAPEVDVHEVRAVHLRHERCSLGHRGGVGAEDLDPDRALLVVEAQVGGGPPTAPHDPLGAYELGKHDIRAEVPAEPPEGRLGDPGLRCQEKRRVSGVPRQA